MLLFQILWRNCLFKKKGESLSCYCIWEHDFWGNLCFFTILCFIFFIETPLCILEMLPMCSSRGRLWNRVMKKYERYAFVLKFGKVVLGVAGRSGLVVPDGHDEPWTVLPDRAELRSNRPGLVFDSISGCFVNFLDCFTFMTFRLVSISIMNCVFADGVKVDANLYLAMFSWISMWEYGRWWNETRLGRS